MATKGCQLLLHQDTVRRQDSGPGGTGPFGMGQQPLQPFPLFCLILHNRSFPLLFCDCDYHQSSATVIYPQYHCVGWALPNTKQTFQDMGWHHF
jgi:hypothetical protein